MPDSAGNVVVRLTMGGGEDIDLSAYSESGGEVHRGCRFLAGKVASRQVDVWIVVESSSVAYEEQVVPDGCLVLVGAEASWPPKFFLSHPRRAAYVRQFDAVYGPHEVPHSAAEKTYPFLPWMINANHGTFFQPHARDLAALRKMRPVTKTESLSAVVSAKTWTSAQRERFRFMLELKRQLDDELHWFGAGINPVDEKWNALAPYRFSVALENSIDEYIITEKFWDPILAFTIPIYWGSPQVGSMVPSQAFVPVDLRRPREAILRVREALSEESYSSRIDALLEARRLALSEFNFLTRLAKVAVAIHALSRSSSRRLRRVDFTLMHDVEDYGPLNRRGLLWETVRRRLRYASIKKFK